MSDDKDELDNILHTHRESFDWTAWGPNPIETLRKDLLRWKREEKSFYSWCKHFSEDGDTGNFTCVMENNPFYVRRFDKDWLFCHMCGAKRPE